MIEKAPLTLEGWVRAIGQAEIPVLEGTALAVEDLSIDEDDIAPRDIAEVVVDDPLMTLKVLAYAATHRHARMVTDAESVTGALLMMGTGAFFRDFSNAARVEDILQDIPGALEGLQRVLDRSHRAARLAMGFAMHRQDTDAEVIHEAALLHDFADALIWCHAPQLALEMQRRQRQDSTLRSAQVQRDVLHITTADLEQELMKLWRLPPLLQHLTNERRTEEPRVRNVMLAVRLARHTQDGWDNAAIHDDIEALADLLNLNPGSVRSLVRDIDIIEGDPPPHA
jgi:HD-like signal output (HDOD) protein